MRPPASNTLAVVSSEPAGVLNHQGRTARSRPVQKSVRRKNRPAALLSTGRVAGAVRSDAGRCLVVVMLALYAYAVGGSLDLCLPGQRRSSQGA
jgi:hypothetical protein